MRTLQLASKAILFLLLVLAFSAPSVVFALDATDILVSGEDTNEPLTLEEDSAVLPSSPDPETAPVLPKIAIYAVNPGYNLSSGKNSGELIELINLSDEELDLSNLSLVYYSKPTSASPDGKATTLYTFPNGATFVGDKILLRFADAPEALDGAQDLTYDAASLAMAGSLKFIETSPDTSTETVISSVCWLGGESCLPVFSTSVKSRQYTTVLLDTETGEYFHTTEYTPAYDSEHPGLYLPAEDDLLEDETPELFNSDPSPAVPSAGDSTVIKNAEPVCSGLEFSEILTYYSDDKSEQFIEIYNASDISIPLNHCRLRYKNKTYPLTSASSPDTLTMLAPNTYFVYYPTITLTKNPTTSNLYELLDINDEVIDSLDLPHGQKKSASFALTGKALDGSNLWQSTYMPTPGEPNVYQEFRSCPSGKVINIATGNCVNVATLDTTIKDCPAGKYRNPATGRCKSYDTDDTDEPAPCQEGYERNPETGRCRKIKQNNGADYPLVPITDMEGSQSFVAIWALIGILALGLLYIVFQFRRDIIYFFRHLIVKLKK